MQEQNFKNHSRYVIGYHFITFGLLAVLLAGSVINLVCAAPDSVCSASLICLMAVILGLTLFYARTFALKAQDRAIRAEENFRYYILTGKQLPASLRMGQVVALRFAPDAEFPALTERAVKEKLAPKAIKQSIAHWRADHCRA